MTEAVLTSASAAIDPLKVLEGITLDGARNTPDDVILGQIQHAIRQGHPQIWRQQEQPQRIALVGGGPSINDTLPELVALVREGALLITVNGAYRWCLDHNLHPHGQIVLDARPSTVRFLDPVVPGVRYWIASQCHPDVWDAVRDRDLVGIFHAVSNQEDSEIKAVLDRYYGGRWQGVDGGTTVISRALCLLRMLGYLRFDLFGVDSCWMGAAHHAFDQPENAHDKRMVLRVGPSDDPSREREFIVSPWHVKQFEDLLRLWKFAGDRFLMRVHGEGLIAYALHASAELALSVKE